MKKAPGHRNGALDGTSHIALTLHRLRVCLNGNEIYNSHYAIQFFDLPAVDPGSRAFAQASGQVTFVVSNQQPETLGQVTVSTASGDNYLAVPGSSTDTLSISETATSITIFGQIVPQGQAAYIILPDQTVVAVMWETNCEIVVVDKDEID